MYVCMCLNGYVCDGVGGAVVYYCNVIVMHVLCYLCICVGTPSKTRCCISRGHPK